MVTISVCMIVKNEEAVLARCLNSLQGIAEEIIIVDTGSTDRTKEIAAEYTDKIYDFTWVNDFAAARNFAFSKATMDYIYSADADEVVEQKDRSKFLQLKQVLLPEVEIVEMIYVNPEDRNMVYNFTREPRPKLFKRLRNFRWIDPIHETVALDPVLYSSDIEIMHLPQSMHSSRDFEAMERELATHGRLSARLYSMYAKELFISGSDEDIKRALPWFLRRLEQPGLTPEERLETLSVVAKGYFAEERFEELLSVSLSELATGAALSAELCYLLGEYYERKELLSEAVFWFSKAALEAECYIAIHCGGEHALRQVIRILKLQGRTEEAAQYEQYLR